MEQLSPAQLLAVLSVLGAILVGTISVVGAAGAVILFSVRQGRALGTFEARLTQVETGHKALAQESRERIGHLEGQAAQRDGDVRELKVLVGSVKEGVAAISGALEELRRYVAPAPKRTR